MFLQDMTFTLGSVLSIPLLCLTMYFALLGAHVSLYLTSQNSLFEARP